MVNYGQNKEFLICIENVDYYPEIAGVKVSNFPMIAVCSIVPLWFDLFGFSVSLFLTLLGFFYRAGRLEDEGRPLFLNANIIKFSKIFPHILRTVFFPALAHIKIHKPEFRR